MNVALLRFAFLSLLGLLAGGCATIVKDDNQPVAFSSDPQGAIVALNGVPRGTTPVTIMVERTRKKQMIELTKEGYQTVQMPLGKHVAGMTFGNIIFGGIIGVGVDYATGKGSNYQDSVMIKLIPVAGPPPPAVALATTASAAPPEPPAMRVPSATLVSSNNGLGLTVAAENGVIVVKTVLPDSAASAAEIKPGDEILSFNGALAANQAATVASAINQPLSKDAHVSWRTGTSPQKTANLQW